MRLLSLQMRYSTVYIFLFLTAFYFCSCSKQETLPPNDLKLNYFPLKLNSAIIYNVDSTVYSDFNNSVIKYQFQIKDTVVAKYNDLQNNDAYKIERYKKINDANWIFQKIISRNIVNNRAEEFIDNRRYVRLVFPPEINKKWNGNLYNDLGTLTYEITTLDNPLNISNNAIDSTLTITQNNEVNLIREDIYTETYGKNIGLVSKEIKAIDKDISTGKIKRGFQYKMTLNSYR